MHGYRQKRTIDGPGPAPAPPINIALSHTAIAYVNAPGHAIKPMSLLNNDIVRAAHTASTFTWIVHGFGPGTFFGAIMNEGTPFIVRASMDVHQESRTLMQSFADIEHISSNFGELLSYLRNNLSSNIQGYCVIMRTL